MAWLQQMAQHGQMLVLSALVLAAVIALVLFARRRGETPVPQETIFADDRGAAVFLFDGLRLIDCSPEARSLIADVVRPDQAAGADATWLALMSWLGLVFPDASARIDRLAGDGRIILTSPPDAVHPLTMTAELRGGVTRIEVRDSDLPAPAAPQATGLLAEEVDLLRRMAALSPSLVWREDAQGAVVWGNAAYLLAAAATLTEGQPLGWPLPRVFEAAADPDAPPRRLSLVQDGDIRWFDVTLQPDGDGRFGYATAADAAAQAEKASRDFLQAMAKAFIHVPIGMAVFDRQRHLQMFNPAMTDLTGLPTDFLIARPTLLAILDAMRDRNMLPEPRDYRSWRRQLAETEDKGPNSGHYEETWMLPGGQSYRVIGRPQPDGWLVLMIEDISTEVTRSHRYRTDIEMGQAVIDTMDEAIAVFAPSGALVMSNTAYVDLWRHDPAATLGTAAISEVAAHWRENSAPSPVWSRIEDFAARLGVEDGWQEEVRLNDGRLMTARVAALSGGATLAAFRPALPKAAPVARVERSRKRA